MAKIRFALRGKATVLMGKNTMMRKVINLYLKDNPGHPLEAVRLELDTWRVFVFSVGALLVPPTLVRLSLSCVRTLRSTSFRSEVKKV